MQRVIEDLQKAAKSPNDEKALAKALLDYIEAKKTDPDAPLYQFGITPSPKLVKQLSEMKDSQEWEKAVCDKAKKYLELAKKDGLNHKTIKNHIEEAMGLLVENCDVSEEGKRYRPIVLLAEAYLMRSNIIRPKGITIPEKKKQAIGKGIKFSEKATGSAKDKKEVEDAWRIKALLYLELHRIHRLAGKTDQISNYNNDIKDVLSKAVENGCTDIDNFDDDLKIVVHHSRANNNDYLKDKKLPDQEGVELEKAMAYKIQKDTDNLYKEMQKLIARLEDIYLTSPLWDDTVNFINELRIDNIECWKDLALSTWEACEKVLDKTMSNLHIRWYWSRQRLLYDLAFMAADKFNVIDEKCHKRADIADSLKSRPALRWNALNESAKNHKILMESLEAESTSGYLKNIQGTFVNTIPRDFQFNKETVPAGWTVIHFYLNQLEKKGYALICNNTVSSKEESDKWSQETFAYDELFNAYMEWQENYHRLPSGRKLESAESLIKLCRKIGEKSVMGFLFKEEMVLAGQPVLFIPHGFLHRLPLHGAINNENSAVFLANHPNCYLPAWSLARNKVAPTNNTNYLLINPDDNIKVKFDTSDFKEINDFDELPKNPYLFAIACHGKADTVNPFNARLMLKNSNSNLLHIMDKCKPLNGTKVILGVCEADLVPQLSDVIDEHLSISTAFLNKGASEVLGTMWVALGKHTNELTTLIKESKEKSVYVLQEWQKGEASEFYKDPRKFSRSVLFRVLGFSMK